MTDVEGGAAPAPTPERAADLPQFDFKFDTGKFGEYQALGDPMATVESSALVGDAVGDVSGVIAASAPTNPDDIARQLAQRQDVAYRALGGTDFTRTDTEVLGALQAGSPGVTEDVGRQLLADARQGYANDAYQQLNGMGVDFEHSTPDQVVAQLRDPNRPGAWTGDEARVRHFVDAGFAENNRRAAEAAKGAAPAPRPPEATPAAGPGAAPPEAFSAQDKTDLDALAAKTGRTVDEDLRLAELTKKQQTAEAEQSGRMARGKELSDRIAAGKLTKDDGTPYSDEEKKLAQEYRDEEAKKPKPVEAPPVKSRDEALAEKQASFKKATEGGTFAAKGSESTPRPSDPILKAEKGQQLNPAEKKAYDDHMSGIEDKMQKGQPLTEQEARDYKAHLDREQRDILSDDMHDVSQTVDATFNGTEISAEAREKAAQVVDKMVAAGLIPGDSLIAQFIRNNPDSPALVKFMEKMKPDEIQIVQEAIRSLALMEMRAIASVQNVVDLQHQAWDIKDAIEGLPPEPSAEVIQGDLNALSLSITRGELDARLAQTLGGIVTEKFSTVMLKRQQNMTRNTVDHYLGRKGLGAFVLGSVGNFFGTMGEGLELKHSSLAGEEGPTRPNKSPSKRYVKLDAGPIKARAEAQARKMQAQAQGKP